jgi:flagellar hook-associated protein 1 FlgK
MSTRFDDANRAADAEIRATVVQINVLAQQLADINRQIAATGGQDVEGLKDQQSETIKSLGNLINVGVIDRPNGTTDVSVGNGRALVIGDNVYALQITPAASTGFAQVLTNGGSVTTDITAEISGGRIGGLIRVRDTLVPAYQSQLDQLAYKISNDVNAVVVTGYDINGAAGVNFFTPPAAVQGAARAMSVNSAVAADTDLVVAAATTAPGDNTIARAVGQLQDTALTGGTATPLQAWGNLVYSVATDASSAEQAQKAHEQVSVQLENLRDQIAGVSLDEEAAFMLRFQRAYEANARFFQTIDQTLDLLMQIANRL